MKIKTYFKLMILALIVASCQKNDIPLSKDIERNGKSNYMVLYTEEQLKNWKDTGNPFLESQHKNSKTTLINENLLSQAGVFEPIRPTTRAFGINPYINRFWTMIRVKLAIPISDATDLMLKNNVITAISEIEGSTNIRFFNAILSPDTDPVWGFKYPNVYIKKANGNQKGSSYIGLKGDEQYIYLPLNADVPFIKRALVNVAGMYNEQQSKDRDTYVNINLANVDPSNHYHFDKITRNYFSMGWFDEYSITLAGSFEFSNNGLKSITMKNGSNTNINNTLSSLDRRFINYFYLPYIARTDTYRELANVVYNSNNVQLTPAERQSLQDQINNYAPYPGTGNQILQEEW